MNKTLRNILIGVGVVAVGTTLYFVFRKPKDKSGDDETKTDEKVEEKKEETKSDEQQKDTSSSMPETAAIKTAQPSSTKTVAETKTPVTTTATKPVVNTDKLKNYNVQLILSKSKNPNVIKGKFVSAEKNGTRLLDKNGKLMFTLKKDDMVGNLLGAKLTAKGDYLAYVKMRDGKVTQTLAQNLKFA